ncbi:MAG: hypothetical protein WC916_07565 [Candidatus Woesearchaeota archaeon]
MWNTIDEWFNTIETINTDVFLSLDRKGLVEQTGISCHVFVQIYNTDIHALVKNLEKESDSFKIPLIKRELPKELLNPSQSAFYLFSPKSQKDEEMYYIYAFVNKDKIDENTMTGRACFFSSGGHPAITLDTCLPKMNAVVDFGRYLQKNNINAFIYSTINNGFWTTK